MLARPSWILILGVLALLPAAAGQGSSSAGSSDGFLVTVSHNAARYEYTFVFQDEAAQEFRAHLDDEGNSDNKVSTAEVQGFQSENTHVFDPNANSAMCFSNDQGRVEYTLINDGTPIRLREVRTTVTGVGANEVVTSTRQVVEKFSFTLEFANKALNPTVSMLLDDEDLPGAVSCAMMMQGWSDYFQAGFPTYPTAPSEFQQGYYPRFEPYVPDSYNEDPSAITIRGETGYSIVKNTVQPSAVRILHNGQVIVADTEPEQSTVMETQFQFTLSGTSKHSTSEGFGTGLLIAGTLAGGVGAAGVGGFFATEFGRYKFFKALAILPLFSRFEKDEVLVHSTREQLYQIIRDGQGPSFSDLRRELDLSNGTLIHHLRILESQEFVKPVRDGFRTRFYVRGPRVIPTMYLTRTQSQLLEVIQANPGITQKDLAKMVGLPRESVFYHARKLETSGKLKVEKAGKWRRYFPNLAPPGAPAGAPVAPPTA